MQHLIEDIVSLTPDTHVYVSSILPNALNLTLNNQVHSYNAGVHSYVLADAAGGQDVSWVDIGGQFQEAVDMIDTLHPNPAGEQIISNAWAQTLESAPFDVGRSPIPEPAGIGLVAFTGLIAAWRRRV